MIYIYIYTIYTYIYIDDTHKHLFKTASYMSMYTKLKIMKTRVRLALYSVISINDVYI